MRTFATAMTITEAFIQLKAFARQDGAILALVWTASFMALMMSPRTPWGNLLAIATPFFVGWRLVRFRDYALDGIISFRRGLAYSWYTFFYASLLFAIAQYLYFRYLDQGTMNALLVETARQMNAVYKEQGASDNQIMTALNMLATLKPIQLSFLFMMQNILIGTILSIPIAAIGMRNVKY